MKHITAIRKPMPLFVAVPTTAGTGSESTAGAVITNANNHSKYPVVSLFLIPQYAVLDETLTIGLPKDVTAYTGMDALTHAVEAYIGEFGTAYTDEEALKAIKMIFENLEQAYLHGENLEYRRNMLVASNYAANAFTRAHVGYVHTISHALSAIYNVGHGKTNAIILPYMLEHYGKSAEGKLAQIAIYTGLGKEEEGQEVLAKKVIKRIKDMNEKMDIPSKVEELKEKDIELVVNKALKEGNPAYPVPKIMNREEMDEIVRELLN
ncbi:iron-containing alcohol dehydrogenase [Cellulosilyticum ruminicola]|uniref:iron-containing alcohol dehydrogenase n=1 Tax=Cellulosilyticum ruminicola TaxID=425254 RepID=UPI0006D1FB7B|nr:iron-containing alcohol dehydrogenase [Cellulosilyticum ruminicola]